jgi:hypothetical protein
LIPILAFLGIIYLLAKRRFDLLSLIFLPLVLYGPFLIIYARSRLTNFLSVAILEKYYLGTVLFLCLLIPFGITAIKKVIPFFLKRKDIQSVIQSLVIATFLVVPLAQFVGNFPKTNLSSVSIGDRYAEDILLTLPPKSVVFLMSDTTTLNTRYFQIAYSIRPDVVIPAKDIGFKDILMMGGLSRQEAENYNVSTKGRIGGELLKNSIPIILKERPIFSEVKFEQTGGPFGKIVSVPWGLLFKLEFEDQLNLPKEEYIKEMETITSSYNIGELEKNKDLVETHFVFADIQRMYAMAFWNIARYIGEYYQDPEAAVPFVQKAIALSSQD